MVDSFTEVFVCKQVFSPITSSSVYFYGKYSQRKRLTAAILSILIAFQSILITWQFDNCCSISSYLDHVTVKKHGRFSASLLLAAYSRKEMSDNEFQKYREYIAYSSQGFEIWTCYTCQSKTDVMHLNTIPMPMLPSCFYNPISCCSKNSKITRSVMFITHCVRLIILISANVSRL